MGRSSSKEYPATTRATTVSQWAPCRLRAVVAAVGKEKLPRGGLATCRWQCRHRRRPQPCRQQQHSAAMSALPQHPTPNTTATQPIKLQQRQRQGTIAPLRQQQSSSNNSSFSSNSAAVPLLRLLTSPPLSRGSTALERQRFTNGGTRKRAARAVGQEVVVVVCFPTAVSHTPHRSPPLPPPPPRWRRIATAAARRLGRTVEASAVAV